MHVPSLVVPHSSFADSLYSAGGDIVITGGTFCMYGNWADLSQLTRLSLDSPAGLWINGKYMVHTGEGIHGVNTILKRDLLRGTEIEIASLGKDYFCSLIRPSRNNSFAVLAAEEDLTATGNFGAPVVKIGQIGDTAVNWVGRIERDGNGNPIISSVSISDDGKYSIVIGYNGKGGIVYCIDTSRGLILWKQNPPHTVKFNDGVISTDGRFCLVVGRGTTICRMSMLDGSIDGSLQLNYNDDAIVELTRITMSNDDRFAAVGSAPSGIISLVDLSKGAEILSINAEAGTTEGMGFSPDGRQLASVGTRFAGVKVWKVR